MQITNGFATLLGAPGKQSLNCQFGLMTFSSFASEYSLSLRVKPSGDPLDAAQRTTAKCMNG